MIYLSERQAKIYEIVKQGHQTNAAIRSIIKVGYFQVQTVLSRLKEQEAVRIKSRGVYEALPIQYKTGRPPRVRRKPEVTKAAPAERQEIPDRLNMDTSTVPETIKKRIITLDEDLGLRRGDIARETGVSRLLIGMVLYQHKEGKHT